MKATYINRGETIDYINDTETIIEAGTILDLKTRIGIAGTTIFPKEMGCVHIVGVFCIAKDNSSVDIGDVLYFDGTQLTAAETGTPAGWAVEAVKAEKKEVYIKLLG